ncbi:MAG: hypothetical protein DRP00_04165, partial [Candidatus Aenigmatarchaeota archaeon]
MGSEAPNRSLQVKTPFVKIDPRIRVIARRYRVPEEILASIRLDPEKIAKAYRAGSERQYFELASAGGKVTILAKPVTFGAYARDDRVVIRLTFPTVTVEWEMSIDEFRKRSPEEWYRALSEWMLVRIERHVIKTKKSQRAVWRARKVVTLKIDEDVESFRWLVEKMRNAGWREPVLNACIAMLRYDPQTLSEDAKLAIVSRILPLVATEPIHGIELTIPGTGKSTVATMYHFALGWMYFTEPPSVATLIGDARTGKSTIAGARGVWFDEIDKWAKGSSKKEELREVIEAMLTGMEQGLWIRGKGGEKQIRVYNPIPCYFSGNVGLVTVNPREVVMKVIEAIVNPYAALAFNERIAFAVSAHKDIADEIQRSVVPNIVRPSVLRGAVKYLREKYAMLPDPVDDAIDSRFKGRFRRHVKR